MRYIVQFWWDLASQLLIDPVTLVYSSICSPTACEPVPRTRLHGQCTLQKIWTYQKHQRFWIRNDKPMGFIVFLKKIGHMRELMTQWRRCELRRQHDLSSDNSSPLKEAQTSPEAPGDVEEMQNEVLLTCPPWKANINEDPSGSWATNSHVHPTINGWPSPTRMTRTSPAASLSNLALSSSWPRQYSPLGIFQTFLANAVELQKLNPVCTV